MYYTVRTGTVTCACIILLRALYRSCCAVLVLVLAQVSTDSVAVLIYYNITRVLYNNCGWLCALLCFAGTVINTPYESSTPGSTPKHKGITPIPGLGLCVVLHVILLLQQEHGRTEGGREGGLRHPTTTG
jgi:hypothetical protein